MNAIRAFLASAKHADTCPALVDDGRDCNCDLCDARDELDSLDTVYCAYHRDDKWKAPSLEGLANNLVQRFRSRPQLDVTMTRKLSGDELTQFDDIFAKCLLLAERNQKLFALRAQLQYSQDSRVRLVTQSLVDVDANIAKLEAEIAAMERVR